MRNISVEVILNLDQWFKRCHLKIFLISIFANLVEGIQGNIHVKLF